VPEIGRDRVPRYRRRVESAVEDDSREASGRCHTSESTVDRTASVMARGVVFSWLLFLALAIALAACGGGGGRDFEVSVEPTSGPRGTTIAYTLTGCDDEHPYVQFYNESSARSPKTFEVVAEGKGSGATGTIVVPDDTAPGEYGVLASCETTLDVAGEAFKVTP
jgi:hypothetical protein